MCWVCCKFHISLTWLSYDDCPNQHVILNGPDCLLCLQKVDRLRSQLHFIGAAAPRQHVVFVDDEAAMQSFSAEQHFDTASELLSRSFNRPRTAQLQEPANVGTLPAKHKQRQADRWECLHGVNLRGLCLLIMTNKHFKFCSMVSCHVHRAATGTPLLD